MNDVQMLDPDTIDRSGRLRSLDEKRFTDMLISVKALGIKTPITIRTTAGSRKLVVGLHRLEAARQLGLQVPCIEHEGDEIDALMWEIAENLHRAELSVQDRSDHVARWIDLANERRETGESAQVEPKLSVRCRVGEGRPESGANAASRALGINRTEAQRAVKIAALTPEAKAAAKSAGLDNNQAALLRAAKAPGEQQAETVHQIARERAARLSAPPSFTRPAPAAGSLDERLTPKQTAFLANLRALARDHLTAEYPVVDVGAALQIIMRVYVEVQDGAITATPQAGAA